MTAPVLLASQSPIRAELLRGAGVELETIAARVDEEAIRGSLEAEGVSPRDMSDALAEAKAQKVARKHPDRLVIGCDQILEFGGNTIGKSGTPEELAALLRSLSGLKHTLWSAAVIYENARPVWRKIGRADLTLRRLSDTTVEEYVSVHWPDVKGCVGGYKIESGGARLFSRIDGDYFSILGLPLLDVLGYLTLKGYFGA